jgi:phenylalanyl-tRNA synthetase beta chain
MKISLEWLKDFVRVELPLPDLLEKLNGIGLMVETVEEKDGDFILDVETYANRPDTLGHLGIAREISALLGLKLAEKVWPLAELPQKTQDLTDIQILDEKLCPRYCGMVVKDVPVGPSPAWLRRRLEAVGLRPINSVVDVTNYVLFATAHPIHAFDFEKLSGRKIIVRKAIKGESLKTLEGTVLELSPEMLVIADDEKPVALAGVMGGEDSGVTAATRDVFIESACFDPVSIRLTAKKTGISTDASYRFERGADPGFPPQAALMAASLLTQMGGRAGRGILDIYPKPKKTRSVILRQRRIHDLLGLEIPEEFVRKTLSGLGLRCESSSRGVWQVDVPSFRVDIDREADLIEEVARFYGYDKIPSIVTPLKSFDPPANKKRERLSKLRSVLLHQGFDEVINFSFADPEKEALVRSGRRPVAIRNPISTRASLMRTNLLVGLLDNAVWNRNRGIDGVHVFEVGNIYFQGDEQPGEQLALGVMTTGLRDLPSWQEKGRETDFFVLKGALEALMSQLRYEPFSFEEAEHPFFEGGQCLHLVYKGERVGSFGLVDRTICAAYALDDPVYAAEIDLLCLFEKQSRPFQYAPVAKFPGVTRDISFLVDRDVSYEEIKKIVGGISIPYLEAFELYDRFAGPSIPKDKVSLSIRFRYRHPKRTLLAEEVVKSEQDIISRLKGTLNIQLREGEKIDNGT